MGQQRDLLVPHVDGAGHVQRDDGSLCRGLQSSMAIKEVVQKQLACSNLGSKCVISSLTPRVNTRGGGEGEGGGGGD
jgi:hypothetical protein